jgi:two-component system chemotaxis response regulator CheB
LKHLKLKKIVLIGASTGGPGQIQKIINALPKLQNTTIIIAQHMAHGFIDSFTIRLNNNSINQVALIKNDETMNSAYIYLAQGETYVHKSNSRLYFSQKDSIQNSYNPDINTLFKSFIPFTKDKDILSIILTGIGDDGVEACSNLSINGARCLTESAQSAIVDGMPSRARQLVPNIEVQDIDGIIKIISEFCE